jgi:hypothetical protein
MAEERTPDGAYCPSDQGSLLQNVSTLGRAIVCEPTVRGTVRTELRD